MMELPKSNEVLSIAGQANAFCVAGDWQLAADLYDRAISLAPESLLLRHCLGSVYLRLSRFVDAESVYRKALEMKPNDAISMHGVGSAIEKRLEELGVVDPNAYEQPVWFLRMALEQRPDYVPLLRDLARAYWMCGHRDSAYTSYLRAVWYAPYDELTLSQWTALLREVDAYDKAVNDLRQYIDDNESRGYGTGPLWYVLGKLFQDLGDNSMAIIAYQYSAMRQPGNDKVDNALRLLNT